MINSEISILAGSTGTTKARTGIAMPEFNQDNIKYYLKEYIDKSDSSIEEIASAMEISKTMIYDILKGNKVGDWGLIKVAKALKLEISIKKPDNQ